jgi:hypothetical protein
VGHTDIILGLPEGNSDNDTMLHAINEECEDSYSDVSIGIAPVHQEKSDQEGQSGNSDADYDYPDYFEHKIQQPFSGKPGVPSETISVVFMQTATGMEEMRL